MDLGPKWPLVMASEGGRATGGDYQIFGFSLIRQMDAAELALVTAYPLPPDYYKDLEVEAVLNMEPPKPLTEDCTSFGLSLLVERIVL